MSNVSSYKRTVVSKGKPFYSLQHFNFLLQFLAKDFTPRTAESYDYHCSLLDSPLSKEYSTTYGINFCSPLNDLAYFHVADQLPQDIMHILLEGVIPYELLLMLTSFITVDKYFKLDLLNDRIACFKYSNNEAKDKPSPIKPQVFTTSSSTISQTCELMHNPMLALK